MPPVPVSQPRATPTATQTGAFGAKQQAPLKPLVVLVQFCSVAPGYCAQAPVAVVQVGGGGQPVPSVPGAPAPPDGPVEVPPQPNEDAIAKQIGALGAKQQEAL